MSPIPVPSPIHYELPLQILERQTLHSVSQQPVQRQLVQELTVTLRKALALQRRLEESCAQSNIDVEHRWSLEEKSTVGEQT